MRYFDQYTHENIMRDKYPDHFLVTLNADGTVITFDESKILSLKIDANLLTGEVMEVGTAIAPTMSVAIDNTDGVLDGFHPTICEASAKFGYDDGEMMYDCYNTVYLLDRISAEGERVTLDFLGIISAFDKEADLSLFDFETETSASILTKCISAIDIGITLNTVNLYTDIVGFAKPITDKPTYRDLIRWVSGINGGFAIVNAEKVLRINTFGNTDDWGLQNSINESMIFSLSCDTSARRFSGARVFSVDGTMYETRGEEGNLICIRNNELVKSVNTYLDNLAAKLESRYKNKFPHKSFSAKVQAMPMYEVGDYIDPYVGYGVSGRGFVTAISYVGGGNMTLVGECIADKGESNGITTKLNRVNGAVVTLETDVDGLNLRVSNVESVTTGRVPQGFKEVEYIEGTGTQFIDTEVKASPYLTVNARIQSTDGEDAEIFGGASVSTKNGSGAIDIPSSKIVKMDFLGKTESARTKWNQLAKELNGTNYRAYNSSNVTATFTDGIAECTVQNSSVSGYQVGVRATDNITIVNGHIYFAFCEINSQKNTSFRVNLNSGSNNFNGGARLTVNTFVKCSVIITASRDYTQFIVSPNEAFSVGQKYSVKNMMLIDLTAIFGSGNEPTTPAAFEAYCEQYGIDLTKYQPQMTDGYTGYVHNNNALWQGNGTQIDIATLGAMLNTAGNVKDTVDHAKGVVNRKVGVVDLGTLTWNYYNDASQKFFYTTDLRGIQKPINSNSDIGNMACVMYESTSLNGLTNNSIAQVAGTSSSIRIKDSTYTDKNDFKTAMQGVLLYYELATPTEEAANDLREINGIRDEYNASTGTITRRIGKVDLGTLTWADITSNTFYTPSLTSLIFKDASVHNQVLCNRYVARNVNASSMLNDKEMSVDSSGNLQLKDTAYTDRNAFKTAMSGVFLYYEVATPVTESVQKQTIDSYDGNTLTQVEGSVANTDVRVRYINADGYVFGIDDGKIEYSVGKYGSLDVNLGNQKHDIEMDRYDISVDGVANDIESVPFTSRTNNFKLFTASGESYFKGKIFGIRIYDDDNDELIFDAVPCVNPSNVPGIYDAVSERFFANDGSGNFNVGGETDLVSRMAKAEAEILVNADAITQKVSQSDFNGAEIVSQINQTAEAVSIDANKINLNGAITANGNVKINTDGSIEAKAGTFGLWDIGSTGKLEAINKGVSTGYIRMADEDRTDVFSEVAIGSQFVTLLNEDNRADRTFDYQRVDIGTDIEFTKSIDGFASKYASYGQEKMQISDFSTGKTVNVFNDDVQIGYTSPVKWKYVEDGVDAAYVNFPNARYIRFGNLVTVMMEVTSASSNVSTRRYFAKLPKPIFSLGVQAVSKSDGKPISGAYYYLKAEDGSFSNTGSMSTSVTHLIHFTYITDEEETRPFPAM